MLRGKADGDLPALSDVVLFGCRVHEKRPIAVCAYSTAVVKDGLNHFPHAVAQYLRALERAGFIVPDLRRAPPASLLAGDQHVVGYVRDEVIDVWLLVCGLRRPQ